MSRKGWSRLGGGEAGRGFIRGLDMLTQRSQCNPGFKCVIVIGSLHGGPEPDGADSLGIVSAYAIQVEADAESA